MADVHDAEADEATADEAIGGRGNANGYIQKRYDTAERKIKEEHHRGQSPKRPRPRSRGASSSTQATAGAAMLPQPAVVVPHVELLEAQRKLALMREENKREVLY